MDTFHVFCIGSQTTQRICRFVRIHYAHKEIFRGTPSNQLCFAFARTRPIVFQFFLILTYSSSICKREITVKYFFLQFVNFNQIRRLTLIEIHQDLNYIFLAHIKSVRNTKSKSYKKHPNEATTVGCYSETAMLKTMPQHSLWITPLRSSKRF